jgi:tetratricopeptide (TPR) repeat protein
MTRRLLADLAVRAGRAHLEKKELKEAYVTAERAVALAAPAPEATIFLGDVLRAQGEWARALAQYEEAAAKWPDSAEPRAALAKHHLDLGHAYLLKGRRREAIQAFRTAVEIPQEKVDVQSAKDRLHGIAVAAFEEGMRLVGEKKFAEAAEAFATSILAEPTRETRFNLGLVLTQAGDIEGAERAYAEALAATPEDVSARLNRAAVLLRLGRWDEAIDEYRWIVAHRPEDDPDRQAAERAIREVEEDEKRLRGEQPK